MDNGNFIQNLLGLLGIGGNSQNIRPYLTPGYNGQPNPMSQIPNAGPQAMIQQQLAGQMQPVQDINADTMPALQARNAQLNQDLRVGQPMQGQGIWDRLGAFLQNPQVQQSLAQIAMSQGKYGGARLKGFQQAQQRQFENQLVQQRAGLEERQMGLQEAEFEESKKTGKFNKLSKLIEWSDALGAPPSAVAQGLGLEMANANDLSRLDQLWQGRSGSQSSMPYVDFNPDSPTYGRVVSGPTADNQLVYQVNAKDIPGIQKGLKDESELFYLSPRGLPVPAKQVEKLTTEMGTSPYDLGYYGPGSISEINSLRGQYFPKEKERESKLLTPEEEAQQIRMTQAKALREAPDDTALIDTIMAHPEVYQTVTPKTRERLDPVLAERGFTGFGKALSDNAIKNITDSQKAIENLRNLRVLVENNTQYFGPIGGLQAAIPWSDAKKAQAEIDKVKQTVGKALEGGVLRKEDEEKYKKILATVMDVPSLALYKIDGLIRDITRDIENYTGLQERAGRNVPAELKGTQSQQAPQIKILKVE